MPSSADALKCLNDIAEPGPLSGTEESSEPRHEVFSFAEAVPRLGALPWLLAALAVGWDALSPAR